jgi:hypothetical protein
MAARDLSEHEARALVRAGLGVELRNVAARCSSPIFWYRHGADTIMNHGTLFLVHTGSETQADMAPDARLRTLLSHTS